MDPRLQAAKDAYQAAGENLRQICREVFPEGCLVAFDEGPQGREYVTVCRVVRHSTSAWFRPTEIKLINTNTGKVRFKDAESLRHYRPARGVA